MPARIAMMAMTTRSSMRVKPVLELLGTAFIGTDSVSCRAQTTRQPVEHKLRDLNDSVERKSGWRSRVNISGGREIRGEIGETIRQTSGALDFIGRARRAGPREFEAVRSPG